MARPDVVALPLPRLRSRARRAYEAARLRQAVAGAWPVLLAAVLAMRLGCSETHILALGIPLLLASITLLWIGGAYGRGVLPGLAAGIAPLVLPALTLDCTDGCSPAALLWCRWSCMAGGLLAGAAVGWRAVRVELASARFALVAAGTALLTGAMGCLLGGALGVTGMVVGFALGAVPVLFLVPHKTAP